MLFLKIALPDLQTELDKNRSFSMAEGPIFIEKNNNVQIVRLAEEGSNNFVLALFLGKTFFENRTLPKEKFQPLRAEILKDKKLLLYLSLSGYQENKDFEVGYGMAFNQGLFYLQKDDYICISTRISDLYPYIESLKPSLYYFYNKWISPTKSVSAGETCYSGIKKLEPNHAIRFKNNNDLDIIEKKDWRFIVPENNIDLPKDIVAKELKSLLEARIGSLFSKESRIGILLSGGIDSHLLAAVIREVFPQKEIHSYGVVSKSGSGQKQMARRDYICQKYQLIDYSVNMDDISYFDNNSPLLKAERLSPYYPFYPYFYDIEQKAKQDDIDIMITGFLGDELNSLTLEEKEKLNLLNASRHAATENGAVNLLEYDMKYFFEDNCQPLLDKKYTSYRASSPLNYLDQVFENNPSMLMVSPYQHQDIIEFMRVLPKEFRRKKSLFKKVLALYGVDDAIMNYADEDTEDFNDFYLNDLNDVSVERIKKLLLLHPFIQEGRVKYEVLTEAIDRAVADTDRIISNYEMFFIYELCIQQLVIQKYRQ